MPTYIDLDLNFARHPKTNDVSKKIDTSAIMGSLKNLIKTANFERPFHPEIGCQVHSLLFEQLTADTTSAIKRSIKYAIDNFEPRVELIEVSVSAQGHRLIIDLEYRIVALNVIQKAKFELERTL